MNNLFIDESIKTKDKSKKLSNEVTKSRKAGIKVKRYICNQVFPADHADFRRFCWYTIYIFPLCPFVTTFVLLCG
jgi:hypothetical protein